MKIIWKHHYLQSCKEVSVNDVIDITPDQQNRWQIRGYVTVKTKLMPEYKMWGKTILVPVAWINQKGCRGAVVMSTVDSFSCEFAHFCDANSGYGESWFYGATPNEVMIKIQEAFDKTCNIFKSL